ncbi:probable respiratory supercomplex factor 1, mitochondrial [Coccomyxa sp. Obi]|nr:probable respiratory supercomplex factor 1, mitochondrial [Coccomyxa sp. Obi]
MSQDYGRQDFGNDILQERKRNPLVLVGAAATAGVLCAGLLAFKQGNADLSQKMMRARVAFQAVTVALMAGSAGMYALSEGTKPGAKKNPREVQL